MDSNKKGASVFKHFQMKIFGIIVQSYFLQKQIQKTVVFFQQLMGIGMGENIFQSGEEKIVSIILDKFDSPYIIFDIGANKGYFIESIVSNLKKGDELFLHAFEPVSFRGFLVG